MKMFLPFVGDDESLAAIKEKLWKAFKNEEESILIGVLGAIKKVGLAEVREYVESPLTANKPNSTGRFKDLLIQKAIPLITPRTYNYLKLLDKSINEDVVISFVDPNSDIHNLLTELNYRDLGEEPCLNLFSLEGEPKGFSSKEELEVYVFYKTHIDSSGDSIYAYKEV